MLKCFNLFDFIASKLKYMCQELLIMQLNEKCLLSTANRREKGGNAR